MVRKKKMFTLIGLVCFPLFLGLFDSTNTRKYEYKQQQQHNKALWCPTWQKTKFMRSLFMNKYTTIITTITKQ